MVDRIAVSDVHFTEAPEADVRTGLVAWIRCVINESLALDGLCLRRTSRGTYTISFPARRDGRGNQRFFVRPITDEARRELERRVFERLHLEREAAP